MCIPTVRSGGDVKSGPAHHSEQKVEYQFWMSKVTEKWWYLGDAPYHIRSNKQIVLAAVQKYGRALKHASPDMQNNEEVVRAAIQQEVTAYDFASPQLQNHQNIQELVCPYWIKRVQKCGWKLRYVPAALRHNKTIIKAAVQQYGLALEFAAPSLQNDKEIVIAAVQQEGRALQYASPRLQNDMDVVLAAVQKDGIALQHASLGLRDNKLVVLIAVRHFGWALVFASTNTQNDWVVVMTAVQNDGLALAHASPLLRNDKKVVLAAVRQNAFAIRDAPTCLQKDKDIVVEYVKSNPDNIKNIPENLKRDPDVLIAAGMLNDGNNNKPDESVRKKKIVLSTRFALNESSWSSSTNFTKLLKQHKYIQSGGFEIYAPNAYDKKTCDPNWTDFDHPCRGTNSTCQFHNVLTETGCPTDDCCWRYSFRYQLEEAKETEGFMLQLVEKEFWNSYTASLGNGQKIERLMATNDIRMKVFQIYRPTDSNGDTGVGLEDKFDEKSIEAAVSAIRGWYDDGCHDMSECIIRPNEKQTSPMQWNAPVPLRPSSSSSSSSSYTTCSTTASITSNAKNNTTTHSYRSGGVNPSRLPYVFNVGL